MARFVFFLSFLFLASNPWLCNYPLISLRYFHLRTSLCILQAGCSYRGSDYQATALDFSSSHSQFGFFSPLCKVAAAMIEPWTFHHQMESCAAPFAVCFPYLWKETPKRHIKLYFEPLLTLQILYRMTKGNTFQWRQRPWWRSDRAVHFYIMKLDHYYILFMGLKGWMSFCLHSRSIKKAMIYFT